MQWKDIHACVKPYETPELIPEDIEHGVVFNAPIGRMRIERMPNGRYRAWRGDSVHQTEYGTRGEMADMLRGYNTTTRNIVDPRWSLYVAYGAHAFAMSHHSRWRLANVMSHMVASAPTWWVGSLRSILIKNTPRAPLYTAASTRSPIGDNATEMRRGTYVINRVVHSRGRRWFVKRVNEHYHPAPYLLNRLA